MSRVKRHDLQSLRTHPLDLPVLHYDPPRTLPRRLIDTWLADWDILDR